MFTQETADLLSIEIVDDNFDSATWLRRVVFLPQQNIWVIWDRVNSDQPELLQQQWLFDIGLSVVRKDNNTIELSDRDQRLQMQWLADSPDLDLTVGDVASESQRGLIGVRWKKMKPTTSLHAMFESNAMESIVIISDPDQHTGTELTAHNPMESFELQLHHENEFYVLEFGTKLTHYVARSS